MITQKVIDQLYKTYRKPPACADDLDIGILFEHLILFHDIAIDDHANLIINSLPESSPFHTIPLSHIHAIVEFENKVAIVLHASIIFLKTFSLCYIFINPFHNRFQRFLCRNHIFLYKSNIILLPPPSSHFFLTKLITLKPCLMPP